MNKRTKTFLVFSLFINTLVLGQEEYYGFENTDDSFGFQTVEKLKETCLNQNVDENSKSFKVVNTILKQMGLYDLDFKMSECPNINNARAQLIPNDDGIKEHYIIYDNTWLNELSKRTTNWAAVGVLAHEIAHFQLDHEVKGGGSRPEWELEADRFLGFQLAKMGATLKQAQSCFQKASVRGSRTHPPKAARLEAVEIGWSRFRLESANELTEDTRLRDVTPQLILDRFSKELGGYQALNSVKNIDYDVEIKQTNTTSNYRANSFNYTQKMSVAPNKTLVQDTEQDELFKFITNNSILGDSLLRRRPINTGKWIVGSPPNGTGNTLKREDHHFIEEYQPRLRIFFDHIEATSKPDKAQFNFLRVPFNEHECFVLELPERVLEKGPKSKTWFRAKLSTKNYYSIITGLLAGSVQEEKINYFKKNKPIEKLDREFVRQNLYLKYEEITGIILPTTIKSSIQERNNRGVLLEDKNKIEQERNLKNIMITFRK
jgi:hypothetical protein